MIIPVELNISEREFEELKRKVVYDNKFSEVKLTVSGAVIRESPLIIEKLLANLQILEEVK